VTPCNSGPGTSGSSSKQQPRPPDANQRAGRRTRSGRSGYDVRPPESRDPADHVPSPLTSRRATTTAPRTRTAGSFVSQGRRRRRTPTIGSHVPHAPFRRGAACGLRWNREPRREAVDRRPGELGSAIPGGPIVLVHDQEHLDSRPFAPAPRRPGRRVRRRDRRGVHRAAVRALRRRPLRALHRRHDRPAARYRDSPLVTARCCTLVAPHVCAHHCSPGWNRTCSVGVRGLRLGAIPCRKAGTPHLGADHLLPLIQREAFPAARWGR
jgi:hypothetical protein